MTRAATGRPVARIHSYNVGDGPDDGKLDDLSTFVRLGATVVLGQEFGDRYALVTTFLDRHPTWRVLWVGGSNTDRKTPVLYDDAVLALSWWGALTTTVAGRWLGTRGAGPDRSRAKQLVRARFRFRGTRVLIKVLNHHNVASAFSTHGAERRNRIAMWLQQTQSFFAVARRTIVPVVGGGDWNAETTNDDLERETPDWWVWDSPGPTLRGRRIDLIGHKESRRVRVLDNGVEETHGSRTRDDHRSPWVTYLIR